MMTEHEQELIALGQAIRRLRRARHLSIKALALEAGVSASHLARIERGHGNPKLDTLYGLARALGVAFSQIVRVAEGEA
jgi:transcriptional regulator with XRE-family HTH domain